MLIISCKHKTHRPKRRGKSSGQENMNYECVYFAFSSASTLPRVDVYYFIPSLCSDMEVMSARLVYVTSNVIINMVFAVQGRSSLLLGLHDDRTSCLNIRKL
jgi:hypothetical protein